MKRVNLFIIFSFLLLTVVVAGMVLNQTGGDAVRQIHRFGGQLVVLTGILALVVNWKSANPALKVCTIAAIVLAVVAGYAGAQLKDTASYDQMFSLMRGAGIFAFIVSAVTATLAIKKKS